MFTKNNGKKFPSPPFLIAHIRCQQNITGWKKKVFLAGTNYNYICQKTNNKS